jgi:uroporphyrin-III C-methyltransferase
MVARFGAIEWRTWQIKHTLHAQQTSLMQLEAKNLQLQMAQQNLKQTFSQTQQHIEEQLFAKQDSVRAHLIKPLLYLAYYSLFYLQDNPNAITALTVANQQLKDITTHGVEVENLRRLLTETLTQLQTTPALDLTAILAQLNTLQTQIMTLPLRTPHPEINNTTQTIASEKSNETPASASWLENLRHSLQNFKQLVVIRHLDQPLEPLLPEEQTRLLQYHLQLSLQQTQWALLHTNATVYRTSLTTLQNLIERYFDTSAQVTQNTLNIIEQLTKVTISTPKLDFDPLLSALDALESHLQTNSISAQPETAQ